MAMFNLISGSMNFEINVNIDAENWLIVKDEQYRPDRGQFILEKFIENFPHIEVNDDPTKVYSLCSRSASLNKWLASVNLEYAAIQNEPTFYRDMISEDEYKKVSEELRDNSINIKNRADDEFNAAIKYKAEMERIEKKYSSFKFKSSQARVISMNTTELPLTLQLAIENYTPAEENSPNRRSYAREILVNYKLALLEAIKAKPDLDIEALIKENYTK